MGSHNTDDDIGTLLELWVVRPELEMAHANAKDITRGFHNNWMDRYDKQLPGYKLGSAQG